ncbi:SRPBCC family protein [Streptomyces sp. NPDC050625]|uniref:SRPBCC family protein n=1 Tax=Streptomyces sp. NPDC050625 TaxID=3154629 RepID=UPI00342B0134
MRARRRGLDGVDGVGRPSVGSRFVGRNRHESFGEWETTSTVIECEPPKVFAWAVQDPDEPSAVWRFRREPENGGTSLTQWMQMGPGRSGLSFAIDAMPDKEQKIVFVRMREFERNIGVTLEHIKKLAEA